MEIKNLQPGDIGFIFKKSILPSKDRPKEFISSVFLYIGMQNYATVVKGKLRVENLEDIEDKTKVVIKRREEISDIHRSAILDAIQSYIFTKKSPKDNLEFVLETYEYAMKPLFEKGTCHNLEDLIASKKIFLVN